MYQIVKDSILLMVILVLSVLVAEAQLSSQPDSKADHSQKVREEIDRIIAEARYISDFTASTKLIAKAAVLLWGYSPDDARFLFSNLWQSAKQQNSDSRDREAALNEVIQHAFLKDRDLARRFIDELAEEDNKREEEIQKGRKLTDVSPAQSRLAKMSLALMEQDVSAATSLLEQSVSSGFSKEGILALIKLREKDTSAADRLVALTMASLKSRPVIISLPAIFQMFECVFPSSTGFTAIPGSSLMNPTSEGLRFQYFMTSKEILGRSLQASDPALPKGQFYSEKDLKYLSGFQGMQAQLNYSLALRYSLADAAEAQKLAVKLEGTTPANLVDTARFLASRIGSVDRSADKINSPDNILFSLAKGNISEAKRLLEKVTNEQERKTYSLLIAKSEFGNFMGKSDLAMATLVTRTIADPNSRILMYLEIIRASRKKNEPNLSKLVLAEMLGDPACEECNLYSTKALLGAVPDALATTFPDYVSVLQKGVFCLNSMARQSDRSDQKSVVLETSKPKWLVTMPEFGNAFSACGAADFDSALEIAKNLHDRLLNLTARLFACERPNLK